jgi:hypothetical protein
VQRCVLAARVQCTALPFDIPAPPRLSRRVAPKTADPSLQHYADTIEPVIGCIGFYAIHEMRFASKLVGMVDRYLRANAR